MKTLESETTSLEPCATVKQSPQIRQSLPGISHSFAGGFDCGNGATKLALDAYEVRCPSYVLPLHGEIYDAPDNSAGGLIAYIEGDRPDLVGSRFLVGYPAYQQNPEAYHRIVDDAQGKVVYGLQMLLGCLATIPYQPRMIINLVASIHHQKTLGEQLEANLKGRHIVEFNACGKRTELTINVLRTLEEGAGAVVFCRGEIDPEKQTLIYDFGNGTCIISVFGAKGRLVDRLVRPGGVENLIDSIARNLEMIRQFAQEGDRQIIRAGIENGTFHYGETGWSFESIYRAELKPWISSTLRTALKAGAKWKATCSHHIAIGGGSQLPLVSELLSQQGINPVKQGAWANARGLRRLAVLLGDAK